MPHPLQHGIDTFFREYVANRRRVSGILLAVSAALFVLVAVGGRDAAENIADAKRFGFEGPMQWVDRIRLEDLAARESPGLYAVTYLTAEARKGGKKPTPSTSHPNAPAVTEKS